MLMMGEAMRMSNLCRVDGLNEELNEELNEC